MRDERGCERLAITRPIVIGADYDGWKVKWDTGTRHNQKEQEHGSLPSSIP